MAMENIWIIGLISIIPTIFLVASIRFLFLNWYRTKIYDKDTRIDGKVVLITGANAGIGKETAIDLARRGAKVYIACRSIERGEKAKIEIIEKSESQNVFFQQLDLASIKSIRAFAERFHREERHLDILINNAGVGGCPKSETEDGFETHFGVNHLGHFLLTNLLLDMLEKSTQARIINVASNMHYFAILRKNDLMNKRFYSAVNAYNQSKLANILFTKELARRYSCEKIASFSLCPGLSKTEIHRYVEPSYCQTLYDCISRKLMRTSKEGAQTTIYCAVEPGLEEHSGGHFSHCKLETSFLHPQTKNAELAKWLWEKSEELLNMK